MSRPILITTLMSAPINNKQLKFQMNYEPSTSQCCRFMEMDALKDAGKIKCYKSHVDRSGNSGGSSWASYYGSFLWLQVTLSFREGGARKAFCTKSSKSWIHHWSKEFVSTEFIARSERTRKEINTKKELKSHRFLFTRWMLQFLKWCKRQCTR